RDRRTGRSPSSSGAACGLDTACGTSFSAGAHKAEPIAMGRFGGFLRRFVPSQDATVSQPHTDGSSLPTIEFRCTLCGSMWPVPPSALQREASSCTRCGSTVRTRAIVHLLTTELFGRSMTIPELPRRRDLLGIGLSDPGMYAEGLAQKLGYTNTFF